MSGNNSTKASMADAIALQNSFKKSSSSSGESQGRKGGKKPPHDAPLSAVRYPQEPHQLAGQNMTVEASGPPLPSERNYVGHGAFSIRSQAGSTSLDFIHRKDVPKNPTEKGSVENTSRGAITPSALAGSQPPAAPEMAMESNGLKEILKPVNSATTPTTRNPQSFYQGKSIVPPMEKVGVSSAASSGTAANPATASAMPKSSQFLDNFLAAKAQRAKERERQKLDGVDKLKTEAEIRQKANDERRLKIKEDLEKVEKDQIQKAEADRLQKIEAEHLQKRLESDRRQAETDRLDSMDRFRKQLEENRRQAALDSSLDQMSLDGSDDGLVVPQNRQLGAASLQRSANNTFNNPDCKCKKSDLKAKGLSASRFAPSSPEDARPTHEGQFTHNSATSVHNKDCPYFEKFLDASEHGIRGEHVQALDKPRSARGLSPHAPSFVYAPTSITSMSPGTTSSAQVTTNSAIFPDKYNGGLARSRWA